MDNLSQTFSALADPTRRAILAQLSKGEASVSDLARPFLKDMSLPGVTKHLKVLERAGLITKSRDAQWRPCRLNAPALKDAADWMEQYRAFWEESLDRLGEYLADVQKERASETAANSRTATNAANTDDPTMKRAGAARTARAKKGRTNVRKK